MKIRPHHLVVLYNRNKQSLLNRIRTHLRTIKDYGVRTWLNHESLDRELLQNPSTEVEIVNEFDAYCNRCSKVETCPKPLQPEPLPDDNPVIRGLFRLTGGQNEYDVAHENGFKIGEKNTLDYYIHQIEKSRS